MNRCTILSAVVALVGFLVLGCLSTTGTSGIRYGMSPDQVEEKLRADNEITGATPDQVVAVGVWKTTNDRRRKVFKFRDGKLYRVEYEALSRGATVGTVVMQE